MHTDRIVTLQGRRYHYTEWGAASAPAVVMLHGITGHARTWDDEARLLATRYRVLALDQRGHGDSDPAPDADYSDAALLSDLEAFVAALDLGRVSLVALSLGYIIGGAITTEYVFSYPGIGLAIVEAINQRDYPVLQGAFLLLTLSVILFNLLADLLYFKLDPRVTT